MSANTLRLLFAGTPDFAARHLEALCASGHEVLAVYTHPDRPAGRGKKLTASPVKQLAEAHAIPVLQPSTLRDPDAQATLADFGADLLIVVAYGLILPEAVLATPGLGCVNVHASLLPRWRGAAPIQRAIEAGDAETGVCLMQMEAGLDTGPVLLTRRTPIGAEETTGDLHDRLATLGAEAVIEAGRLRLRPILMTTGTTILGLLPVMVGNVFESGSQVMQRIAAPMVGGLVSATVLTLLIIPAIYMVWKGALLKQRIRRELRDRAAA